MEPRLTGDGEFVRRSRSGDGAAYGELVRRWSARVVAMCRARLRTLHAAEDAAQETLLRGWRSIGTLEDVDKFGGWLRGIAHRVCLDWWKSRQNGQVPFSTLGPAGVTEPCVAAEDDPLERAEESRRLWDVLDSLEVEHRETLMLYYTRDLTYRELAELLGVSVGTVNARLAAAREKVRLRLVRAEAE